MTSETNPETGTITYVYDSDPSSFCPGTYRGDLVKRVDAAGNSTCYTYDLLHRVMKVSYAGGASSTPTKNFTYDDATITINGSDVSMANAKGRLAEAYTGNHETDVALSYSETGAVTDAYEATANSGGFYHLSASYWANGELKQLGGLPGLPTFTYGLDGKGRINSVAASTGQNPCLSVSYNAASSVTGVTFGSLDQDTFVFDPKRGSLCQYQASINGQTVAGTLSWNRSGTLKSLLSTDPFNLANDAKTCTYSYDDLGRATKVDCGTTWGQEFAYDPFGNISKNTLPGAQGLSFQASYEGANGNSNRIQSVPGATPTYDGTGNLLSDGSHTYSWDVENRATDVDAVKITYDALGRAVEVKKGGVFSQIVYRPDGSKLAIMHGQSLSQAFVPLPGGATAIYNSLGQLAYYRHPDWLGSSRLGSTPNQTVYSDTAYAPFGEPYNEFGTVDRSFAGHDEDTTTGIYDAPFRQLSPTQGRWISPDPAGLGAVDPDDPQTWNRYAYVHNNPLSFVDPLGLEDDGCLYLVRFLFNLSGVVERYSVIDSWCPDSARVTIPIVVGAGPGREHGRRPANNGSISAYHGTVLECAGEATVDLLEDLVGVSLLPGSEQDNWSWSSDKIGFVYVGEGWAAAQSVVSFSTAADATKKSADFISRSRWAQGPIRTYLRNQGLKVSWRDMSRNPAKLGKWAGRFAKVLSIKTAGQRYFKCRG